MKRIRHLIREICPPFLWKLSKKVLNGNKSIDNSGPEYQGVLTLHSMKNLHSGKFAEYYDKYIKLLPDTPSDSMRLRHYMLCLFADLSKNIEGDFLIAGVSHGVASRIIYDYVDFDNLSKTFHFIDPFLGVDGWGKIKDNYNADIDFVRGQYPPDAPIKIHKEFIPDCFPINNLKALSFVHLNTAPGTWEVEAKSLKYLYSLLKPGGFIIIDNYAVFSGYESIYDPYIKQLSITPYTLITGQCVLFKPQECLQENG